MRGPGIYNSIHIPALIRYINQEYDQTNGTGEAQGESRRRTITLGEERSRLIDTEAGVGLAEGRVRTPSDSEVELLEDAARSSRSLAG